MRSVVLLFLASCATPSPTQATIPAEFVATRWQPVRWLPNDTARPLRQQWQEASRHRNNGRGRACAVDADCSNGETCVSWDDWGGTVSRSCEQRCALPGRTCPDPMRCVGPQMDGVRVPICIDGGRSGEDTVISCGKVPVEAL